MDEKNITIYFLLPVIYWLFSMREWLTDKSDKYHHWWNLTVFLWTFETHRFSEKKNSNIKNWHLFKLLVQICSKLQWLTNMKRGWKRVKKTKGAPPPFFSFRLIILEKSVRFELLSLKMYKSITYKYKNLNYKCIGSEIHYFSKFISSIPN